MIIKKTHIRNLIVLGLLSILIYSCKIYDCFSIFKILQYSDNPSVILLEDTNQGHRSKILEPVDSFKLHKTKLSFIDSIVNHFELDTIYAVSNPGKRDIGGDINCIFEDSRGVIWIGTEIGLFEGIDKYFSRNYRWAAEVHISKKCNTEVLAITEDKHNKLWIRTKDGFSKLDWHKYSMSCDTILMPDEETIFKLIRKKSNTLINSNNISSNSKITYFTDRTGQHWIINNEERSINPRGNRHILIKYLDKYDRETSVLERILVSNAIIDSTEISFLSVRNHPQKSSPFFSLCKLNMETKKEICYFIEEVYSSEELLALAKTSQKTKYPVSIKDLKKSITMSFMWGMMNSMPSKIVKGRQDEVWIYIEKKMVRDYYTSNTHISRKGSNSLILFKNNDFYSIDTRTNNKVNDVLPGLSIKDSLVAWVDIEYDTIAVEQDTTIFNVKMLLKKCVNEECITSKVEDEVLKKYKNTYYAQNKTTGSKWFFLLLHSLQDLIILKFDKENDIWISAGLNIYHTQNSIIHTFYPTHFDTIDLLNDKTRIDTLLNDSRGFSQLAMIDIDNKGDCWLFSETGIHPLPKLDSCGFLSYKDDYARIKKISNPIVYDTRVFNKKNTYSFTANPNIRLRFKDTIALINNFDYAKRSYKPINFNGGFSSLIYAYEYDVEKYGKEEIGNSTRNISINNDRNGCIHRFSNLRQGYILDTYSPYQDNRTSPPIIYITNIKSRYDTLKYSNFSLLKKMGFSFEQEENRIPSNLILPNSHNSITFQYEAEHSLDSITYVYKLLKKQQGWLSVKSRLGEEARDTTDKRSIKFPSLEAGNYQLELSACNRYGYCSTPYQYAFVVRPMWYYSTWFRSVCFIACLFLLGSLFLLKRVKERIVRRTMEQIRDDFHDSTQNTVVAMRNLIAETQLGLGKKQDISIYLDKLSDYSRQVNEDISVFIKAVGQKKRSLSEVMLDVQSKAVSSIFRFNQPEFEVHGMKEVEHFFDQKILDGMSSRELQLLLREAMSNAKKYSEADLVCLNMAVEDRKAIISIEDNGVGFDIQNTKLGHGFKTMQKRAKNINAELTIYSEVGKGTIIKLLFPLENERLISKLLKQQI